MRRALGTLPRCKCIRTPMCTLDIRRRMLTLTLGIRRRMGILIRSRRAIQMCTRHPSVPS